MIAALAEGTLPARERSGAEAHVADCGRCQAVLAALARTMPPVVPRAWWRQPAFVWLAPLTAAAAALIIWTAVPRREIAAPALQLQRDNARAVEPVPAQPDGPPQAAEPQSQREAAVLSAPPPPAAPAAGQQRDRIANRQRAPEMAQQKAFADSAVAPLPAPVPPAAAEARIAGTQMPSTPTPPAAAAPAPPPPPAASADASANRALAGEAQRRASAGAMAVTSDAARQTLARRFEARETTIVSADSSSRWRLGPLAGFVQHSTDGGATWQVLPTGVNATLFDGSSPSQRVCWLVGQGGVVVLTTDAGRTWQRLTVPVSIDLRSVSATSEKTATVVAVDGRRFVTADGGQTWRP
jgi:hypothetical protein